jgi:hypothetical protein
MQNCRKFHSSTLKCGIIKLIFVLNWSLFFVLLVANCNFCSSFCCRVWSIPIVVGRFRMYSLVVKVKVKVKRSRYRPAVSQRVPGSSGSQTFWQRHRTVMRSASRTGLIYPQEVLLVLISVRCWVDPRAIVRSEVFMSMKNSTDTIWYRTSDYPICSTVP